MGSFEGALRRLSHLMVEADISSNAELARRTGLNENTIRGWFKEGRKRYLLADDAVLVARALRTTVEYMVTGERAPVDGIPPELADLCRLLQAMSAEERSQVIAYAEGLRRGRDMGRARDGGAQMVAG